MIALIYIRRLKSGRLIRLCQSTECACQAGPDHYIWQGKNKVRWTQRSHRAEILAEVEEVNMI